MNSPSETDVDCNEIKVDENNITDNIYLQEMSFRIFSGQKLCQYF